MHTTATIPLSRLMNRLSPILLHDDSQVANYDINLSGFVIYDAQDIIANSDNALVLGVGIETETDMRDLAFRYKNAAAIVLREEAVAQNKTAHLSEQPIVIRLRSGATWSQFVSSVVMLFGGPYETPESVAFKDSESDLFTLANSVANLAGGPVTIEDLSFRILAFSSNQVDADEARANAVLGHQVPEAYSSVIHERGIVRLIYESPTPIYIDNLIENVKPRVVMRLQAGGEILGSIWVVVNEPLSAERQQGLIEISNVIAVTMLRIRMTQDSSRRLKTQSILALLDGGSRALEEARRLHISPNNLAVFALGMPNSDNSSEYEFRLQRIASALSMYLHTIHSGLPVAIISDTIYAVVPLKQETAHFRAKAVAEDFLLRLSQTYPIYIGVGSPTSVRNLPNSKEESDRAIRVLRKRNRQEGAVACMADVMTESLLLRMTDLIDDSKEFISGPIKQLRDYDEKNGTQMVETLQAWLDHFGDVSAAAEELIVHKNTFRYRLKRLHELAGINLNDPDERFGLMLQLKLFAM